MTDIVERLRERKELGSRDGGVSWLMLTIPDQQCNEAADEIERLRAIIQNVALAIGADETLVNIQDAARDRYREEVAKINRATDREIDAAMNIHKHGEA